MTDISNSFEVPEIKDTTALPDFQIDFPDLSEYPKMSLEDTLAEVNRLISDNHRWLSEMQDISPLAYDMHLDECKEIARNVFSSDVRDEWYEMSSSERTEIITEYGKKIASEMGIQFKGIVFDVTEEGTLGYTNGDGCIHLAKYLVNDPGQIIQLIDTVSHELRHQFQYEAFHDPEKFGIDAQTAREWQLAWEVFYSYNPVSFYDPIAYKYNPCEIDARHAGESIAQSVVRDWYKEIAA